LPGKRVLDVGCGSNAPMTLMLHSSGVQVTGVDGYVGYRWGLGFQPGRYARYLREAGAAKTLRKAAGEIVYDRHYYKTLSKTLGFPLTEQGLDLRVMRVEALQVPDASVDVIHSNATWEHVADVDSANRELARVLRPGGVAYIEIHLFPSLSGGHDLPWIVPGRIDLGGITPWGHLRHPATWVPPVFLNRFRERDYRRSFEAVRELDILDWKTEFTEAHELVTPELLADLPDYSAEELTKRSIIVVLRRTEGR
jgi:SAM-dependent methyltransferase